MIVALAATNTTATVYTSAIDAYSWLIIVLAGVLLGILIFVAVAGWLQKREISNAFETAVTMMAQTTTTAVQSMSNSFNVAVNAILLMSGLQDVNTLAQKKADTIQASQQQQQPQPQQQQK